MKTRVVNNSLVDQVYALLKDMIIKGELKPGNRIIELDVAKKFGVSQGPVREALSHLENEGLVIRHRYKGTFVSNLSKRDTREIYELREITEEFAIKRAIKNIKDEDIEKLDSIIEEMMNAGKEKDIDKIGNADKKFHDIIFKNADNDLLLEVWEDLSIKSNRIWYLNKQIYFSDLMDVAKIHKPIVEALKIKSTDDAVQAFREHLNYSKQEIIKELDKE